MDSISKYVCIDFSENYCSLARDRLKVYEPKTVVINNDITEGLPIESESMDLCIVNEVFDDLPVDIVRKSEGVLKTTMVRSKHGHPGFEWIFYSGIDEEISDYMKEYELMPDNDEQKVCFIGMTKALKEFQRIMKPGAYLFIMDYIEDEPEEALGLDHHYPIANITTPLDKDILIKSGDKHDLELIYTDPVHEFFKEGPEGKTLVEYTRQYPEVRKSSTDTSLWEFVKNTSVDFDYHVFLLKKRS